MNLSKNTENLAYPVSGDDKRLHFGRFVEHASLKENLTWHFGAVSSAVRESLLKQRPVTLWLTGLSASGKSSIAYALEKLLLEKGKCSFVLDGDNLRHHLNSDLGFTAADRKENIRRTAEVAHLMNEAGLIVITALISPLCSDRQMAREIIGAQRFLEVYVNASAAVCESRDPKGLYVKARRGEIPEFTGISAPYEVPDNPEFEVDSESDPVGLVAEKLYQHLAGQYFPK